MSPINIFMKSLSAPSSQALVFCGSEDYPRVSKGRRQTLTLRADNGNAVAEGFREAIESGHAGEPAGGAGRAQVVLQAEGIQRQPLLGVVVPHRERPAGLPPATIAQRGRSLLLGLCIRGLVKSPPSPQRHPVRDARSAPQRRCRCDLLPTNPAVRTGPSTASPPLEPQHTLLASAGGVVWINPPPPENTIHQTTLVMAA
ncbi:MAG: hypothetical protein EBS30_04690 [Planctomycetes bacterium]|nr:hypothetical protein [Planctomycetota bacterium]